MVSPVVATTAQVRTGKVDARIMTTHILWRRCPPRAFDRSRRTTSCTLISMDKWDAIAPSTHFAMHYSDSSLLMRSASCLVGSEVGGRPAGCGPQLVGKSDTGNCARREHDSAGSLPSIGVVELVPARTARSGEYTRQPGPQPAALQMGESAEDGFADTLDAQHRTLGNRNDYWRPYSPSPSLL